MVNNCPLVSVIVPMFNAELSVGEAICSVQEQTYQYWEMLIVDNCSTDNSRDIVRDLAIKDKRIRLIESDFNSGGPAKPRNIGIKNAGGKYIAFLDADDLWLPTRLEKQVSFLEGNKGFFLVYSKCFIKKHGEIIKTSPRRMYSGHVFNQLYLEFNFISSGTVLMVNQKGPGQYLFPEDEKFNCIEDYVLWLTIAKDHKVGFIDEPLAIYVLHENNLSAGVFKTLERFKIVIEKFAQLVPKRILILKYISFYCKFFEMSLKEILKMVLNKVVKYLTRSFRGIFRWQQE